MIGGIFHIWFGAFIGKQTMKTRAVSVYAIFPYHSNIIRLLIHILYTFSMMLSVL